MNSINIDIFLIDELDRIASIDMKSINADVFFNNG
jgi:hypothetical protein